MPYMTAGEKHARWTLLEDAVYSTRKVLCRCECGTEKSVAAQSLRSGLSRSCGCLKSEVTAARNASHGLSNHPLYGIWLNMVYRCTKPTDHGWADYGGRGIQVCDRWLGDVGVANFIADMGARPTPQHSLDRLNNNGHYEPGNCAWTTKAEQSQNTRPKIRNTKYAVVLMEIERLRELVRDLGGNPGDPFQELQVKRQRRAK